MLFQSFQEAIALRTMDYRDRWWRGPSGTRVTLSFACTTRCSCTGMPRVFGTREGTGGKPCSNHPRRLRKSAGVSFSGPPWSAPIFVSWVEKAQEYIRSGDIYQVNLSHCLEAAWPGGEPWAFYEALRHYSPAPYGAFLRQQGRTVLSSSPELFLKFAGPSVHTRPIKGTRPRRADPDADAHSAFDLLTSPKEIAELVMITDLERNDLGQCCEWGSVRVSELLKLEQFEQVFHLISTVEGRLREGVDQVTALQLCFPGGSITGAPKKRAREVIAELEPVQRGLYTGAAGWFGASGDSAFNILIRTVFIEEGRAHFHVGAGIVADSVPHKEWQETWDKACGILLAAERLSTSLPKQSPLSGSCVASPLEQC
jgi:para-aminobenzoate synthetase component I